MDIPRLLRFSRRDRLPLFDQLAADLQIRPFEEVRLMGRHFDDDGDGVADQDPPRRTFSHDDGSVYERVPAAEIYDDGDLIDSTTIVDEGAPD